MTDQAQGFSPFLVICKCCWNSPGCSRPLPEGNTSVDDFRQGQGKSVTLMMNDLPGQRSPLGRFLHPVHRFNARSQMSLSTTQELVLFPYFQLQYFLTGKKKRFPSITRIYQKNHPRWQKKKSLIKMIILTHTCVQTAVKMQYCNMNMLKT